MNKKLFITFNIVVEDTTHAKKVWMQLQADVFDANLQAEFCDFYLEHPDCNIIEIDRLFREEWDL